ncbi:MAG: tetratricopeptide repeat protein [Bacteroides sp.]|nr:tetratricopeptide repeat protein [Bacteroides sp.]
MNTDLPKDKELLKAIRQYETARDEGKTIYLDSDEFCNIANFYTQENRIKEATEVVERALTIHPDNLRLLSIKLSLYLFEDKVDKAWEVIESINDQNSPITKIAKVELLIYEHKNEEAGELLQTISFDEVKDEDELILNALYSYYDLGMAEEGLNWLGKHIPRNVLQNSEIAEFVAECYVSCSRYEEAITLYNKLLDEAPYSAPYWVGLAKALLNDQQLDKVAEACDFALVADENNKEAHIVKAHLLFQLEDYESAIKEFEQSVSDPMYNHAFIAFCHVNLENYEEGFKQLKKIVNTFDEDSPLYPFILMNYAKCLYETGQTQEAMDYFEDLYERFPDFTEGHMLYAEMLINQNRVKEAFDHFLKALEFCSSEDVWYQMAVTTFKAGYYQDALPLFKKVEEADPDYKHLIKYLTISYYYLNDTDNFRIYKTKVLKDLIGFEDQEDLNDPRKESDIINMLHYYLDSDLSDMS